jgi:dTDP-4-dehydrorhamnose reductase
MKKTILVTGANGLLGQKLVYALAGRNDVELIATSRGDNRIIKRDGYTYEPLDITDKQDIEKVFSKYRPDAVINTAAMTNVDACETQKEECWKLNVTAVQYLVEVLEALQEEASRMHDEKAELYNKPVGFDYRPHFIHLSTDFIFDGEDGPYDENATPNPLSYYGLSKYEAEKIVQKSKVRWAIARTIIVYGIVDNMSRSNIVLWAKDALGKGQTINVVDDQFRSPTLAEDLAEGCILIAMKGAEGIYNISGKDTMSILELVHRVADHYGLDKSLVNPIKSNTLNQAAKRPPRTGFIIDKARKELGYNPHSFEEGIKILEEQLAKAGK